MKMKASLQVILISSILFFVSVKCQAPAIGDIRLERYEDVPGFYEVLVYYSDGVNPPEWGGICADISLTTVEVICRQVGQYPSLSGGSLDYRDTGRPVWLKKVTCSSDNTHILQCGHEAVTGSERNSLNSCGVQRQRQLIRCDFNNRLEAYDGEIRLCPPDSAVNDLNNKSSTSFGVVALHISFDDEGLWRGIIQFSPGRDGFLNTNEANAICRQLGFTDAVVGSAVARSATGYSFDNCYRGDVHAGYKIQSHAWMKTGDVKCNDGPQNCLGCCYLTPPETGCQDCEILQDIAIGCTFDITKSEQTTGTEVKCNLDNKQCLTECSSEKKLILDIRGGLGFFAAFLLLTLIIVCISCCNSRCRDPCICFWKKVGSDYFCCECDSCQ